MKVLRKSIAVFVAATVFLTGCAAGGAGLSAPTVGPQSSSSYTKAKVKELPAIQKPKLDIIIPVFDPGLPDDPETYKEAGIWPELRRAEATRFAYKMKLALENSGVFGAVRVMPDTTATGDLYVVGKINESNGEQVAIDLQVYDISGKRWLNSSFDHEVAADFHSNIRNEGKDPYDPVFKKAADRIVEKLKSQKDGDLRKVQALTDLRFGASFSEQAFSPYMKVQGGKVSLLGYPDADDSMLNRVKAIRVRDQLFTDRMQPHYEQFNQKMEDSYVIWQKQSFNEVKAAHEAKMKAVGSAVAGVALIAVAVLSAIAGARSDTYGGATAGTTGAIVAGQVGAGLLGQGMKMNEESKFHQDALDELGSSIDGEMAPQVVNFEKTTMQLTGSAKEQFAQWRTFLKSMYEQEATPDVQL